MYVHLEIIVHQPVPRKFLAQLESTHLQVEPKVKMIVLLVHLANTAHHLVFQLQKETVMQDIIVQVVMIRINLALDNVLQENSVKQGQSLPKLVSLEHIQTLSINPLVIYVLKGSTAKKETSKHSAQRVIIVRVLIHMTQTLELVSQKNFHVQMVHLRMLRDRKYVHHVLQADSVTQLQQMIMTNVQ